MSISSKKRRKKERKEDRQIKRNYNYILQIPEKRKKKKKGPDKINKR
jgi:hypothetical protein